MAVRTTAVGVFSDRTEAQRAIEKLRMFGFLDNQIGVVTQKHDDHVATVKKDPATKAIEGAEIGAAAGAGVGVMWALGIAAAVFPPLGVVVGGTLMAVLASAGAGAVAVGLV
jgi:hypothetical protein